MRRQGGSHRCLGRAETGGGGGRAEKMAARCLLSRFWGPLLLWAATLGGGEALGSLNLLELSELKYGIEIGAEPVLAGQSKSADVVTISSKYKQKYECRLPAAAVKIHQDKEEDPQSYTGLGISELLKPMEAAPCLIKTKDWWTYEFCYGKHIQQYHMEESEIKGDILYLGYYQSAFDWDNETAKASKQHKLKRYHSQTYVNGSKCNLNGKPREAEVRFLCEEGAGDYIARVDEPQSCSYVLTVHTTRICHHPFLRPPSTATPQTIRCHPALSPAEYVEYVKAQVSDTKRKVEEISEELNTLGTRLWNEPDRNSAVQDADGNAPSPPPETKQDDDTNFWEGVMRGDGKASQMPKDTKEEESILNTEESHLADFKKKIHFKIIRNPGDLVQFIHDLKESARKNKEKTSESEASAQDTSPKKEPKGEREKPNEGAQEEEEEDEEELLGKFEKELEDILLQKSEMAELKEEVKSEMEKEFDHIINEVKDELETEGLKGEFDRKQASKSLASTLNKLIDKLDSGKAPNKGDKEQEQKPEEDEEEEETPLDGGDSAKEDAARAASDGNADGRVKVRVTKVKPGSARQKELRVQEMSRDNPQLRHIESVVKDLLEKEGLKAEGKIEIKIVTTGGLGDDDDTHWLSEEDTKNLKDIFFNILIQGTEEAHKEQRRQRQLEDNYRFVWRRNQEDLPTTGGTDSDELDF
ncbi:protein OS-9 isoform X1 [Anolis carolinensis]|uniref:protein OS-9 isoform X1 n=1 Tax=Anolis carolinensis TaxID=28377 RepID=UPI0007DB7943|nr:PREDICTED: protein OS-9 [Anolis carolinensis]|eukprot:XP_016853972.1 PREDICTED: protein OS-9 [Anolis carolinensis]